MQSKVIGRARKHNDGKLADFSNSICMQEAVAAVLGICFRVLADPKNSDSVLSTAMATVRQVKYH